MTFESYGLKLSMNTSGRYTIDLNDFATDNNRSFKTRTRAIAVRSEAKLDAIASEYEEITIIVPSDITLITPAFFEEFFEPVVNRIGAEGVRRKFHFENEGAYKINNDFDEALDTLQSYRTSLAVL